MTSSYRFSLQAREGARAWRVPQRRLPQGRADQTASPSKAGIASEEENGEPPCPNRRRPPEALSPGRAADPPHKRPTFAIGVTPSVGFYVLSHFEGRGDVSLSNFLLALGCLGRCADAKVLRDKFPFRRV